MLRSIKTKVLLLIVGIMLATALILVYFTKRDVGEAVLGMEEKSIRNAMYLIKLNVENEYKSLLFHKIAMLTERKEQMKSLAAVVMAGINDYQQLAEQGRIAEDEAKRLALDSIQKLRDESGAHFFVYDEHSVVLGHPNPALIGQDLSSLKDVKGLSLFDSMLKKSMREGDGYASFSWDDMNTGNTTKQLGYFVFYPKWNWMIATAIQTEDLEQEAEKKLNLVIKELKSTFDKTQIAKTGYLILFNGKKEILIDPRNSADALLAAKDPSSGELLLDKFMAAAKHPEQPIKYLWDDPSNTEDGQSRYESYAEYFKTLNWYIVSVARESEIQTPAKTVVLRQTLFIAVIFAASILIAYFLVKGISQHLKKLTDHAKQLPAHDFSAPETELPKIEQLAVKYKDEVGKLAEAFLFMEASLQQYIQDLKETTAAKERIESELAIARDIQMSILPKLFPAFPERPEFDIYATVKPAREVGGDFYDFFFVDESHLFFALGDVSGKGIPASLFMAVSTAFLRASATRGVNLDEVMARVNTKLCAGNDTCMFVTVFCGLLDIRTGEVICSDGGHNPPLLIASKDGVDFLHARKSSALGVFEDMRYYTQEFVLKEGDALFLYTDGVTEAMNTEDELYSEERLKESILELRDRPVKDITREMIERIEEFARGAPQADDITMLVLRYTGPAS
ncbi:MAG: SpoIIE family protein phosphatase [Desulforhabdus sp.]|nr:SpoIIE family protein phosphatase [Desulforhabdus sp.]